jgi:hypothetical protein
MKTVDDFDEWYQTATQKEKELASRVDEYEGLYFEDMTLKPDSIIHDFISHTVVDDDGKEFVTSDDMDFRISIIPYQFKISRMRNCSGRCNPMKRIMCIHPKYIADESVILHEMIHAYEHMFLQNDGYSAWRLILRDILTFCLYNSLKPKINDLDRRILEHSHIIRQERITVEGGLHGILFYLKSLDLDLRLGLKLGTVCGYGRDTGEEI